MGLVRFHFLEVIVKKPGTMAASAKRRLSSFASMMNDGASMSSSSAAWITADRDGYFHNPKNAGMSPISV